jgi:hypothetical protein
MSEDRLTETSPAIDPKLAAQFRLQIGPAAVVDATELTGVGWRRLAVLTPNSCLQGRSTDPGRWHASCSRCGTGTVQGKDPYRTLSPPPITDEEEPCIAEP